MPVLERNLTWCRRMVAEMGMVAFFQRPFVFSRRKKYLSLVSAVQSQSNWISATELNPFVFNMPWISEYIRLASSVACAVSIFCIHSLVMNTVGMIFIFSGSL